MISMLAAWSAPACEEMACCKKGKMCPAHADHSPKNQKKDKPGEMPCAQHAKAARASEAAKSDCAMSACCSAPQGQAAMPALGKMILAGRENPVRLGAAMQGVAHEAAVEASGFVVPPFEPPRS